MLSLTPSPLGQLPDPVRCQTHLRELTVMAEDDRLRQHLLEALLLTSPSEEIIKSKVSVVREMYNYVYRQRASVCLWECWYVSV